MRITHGERHLGLGGFANEGEKLDRVLSRLGNLHRRMDAIEGIDRSDDDNTPDDPLAPSGTPRPLDDDGDDDDLGDAPAEQFADAQAKAERVALAFGDSVPLHVNGESLLQYRRRLLDGLKGRSSRWAAVDVRRLSGAALGVAEAQIYSDAQAAAADPATIPRGELRMITETDETGRRIRKFYGDPEAAWGPFKHPTQHVVGWNVPAGSKFTRE